jgi:hypothetical protein
MATAKTTAVTINVTITGATASAPSAVAHLNDEVTWVVDGEVAADDEVSVGGFRRSDGTPASPMAKADHLRKRTGKGAIGDSVRANAGADTYKYDIAIRRSSAGGASLFDPEIQIKP